MTVFDATQLGIGTPPVLLYECVCVCVCGHNFLPGGSVIQPNQLCLGSGCFFPSQREWQLLTPHHYQWTPDWLPATCGCNIDLAVGMQVPKCSTLSQLSSLLKPEVILLCNIKQSSVIIACMNYLLSWIVNWANKCIHEVFYNHHIWSHRVATKRGK